jgi:hypothetical protein
MRRRTPFWLLLAVAIGACSTSASERTPASRGEPAAEVTTAQSTSTAHPPIREHRVRGTNGDDRLVGTPGRDLMDGLRGTDTIRGRAGDDELRDHSGVGSGRRLDPTRDFFDGGPGDDVIFASQRDRVRAGPGDDTVYADYLEPGVVISCGRGRDVVITNDDLPGVVLRGCEKLRVAYAG